MNKLTASRHTAFIRPTGIAGYGLAALCLLLISVGPVAADGDESASPESVAPLLWLPAMNVFRRHTAPEEEMFHFYGAVLGYHELGTIEETGVTRFQVGPAEVKFAARTSDRQYVEGGVTDATGLRLLTFFFPDRDSAEAGFREYGLPLPVFHPLPDSNRLSALVQDPDGQWLQLIVAPGEDAAFYERMEIGLTVSDIDASRDFYASFLGLTDLGRKHDPVFDTPVQRYRNGSTLIALRSFGHSLPADTGSGGIQYVVSDIHRVVELIDAHDITVDQPLTELPAFNYMNIWVEDPDGITHYFAQTGQSASGRPWGE